MVFAQNLIAVTCCGCRMLSQTVNANIYGMEEAIKRAVDLWNRREQKLNIDENKIKELDSHWEEVMTLAKKYGFISDKQAGLVTIAPHKVQRQAYADTVYVRRQKEINSINVLREE